MDDRDGRCDRGPFLSVSCREDRSTGDRVGRARPLAHRTDRAGSFLTGSGDSFNITHGGQNEGFVSQFKLFPNTGKGAVIMVNIGEAGARLMREIELAIAEEFAWPGGDMVKMTTVPVDPDSLKGLAGGYVLYNLAGRDFRKVVAEGSRRFTNSGHHATAYAQFRRLHWRRWDEVPFARDAMV